MLKHARRLSALIPVFLMGCNGSGDNDGSDSGTTPPEQTQPATAEGVYGGSLSGSASSDFQALVLENGEFWSLYGNDTGSIFYIEGFVQGTGASNDGSFTSANLRDFGFLPAASATVAATYNATAGTISGTITYPSLGNVQFSGGPIPGSLYDYDTPASLANVTGSWSTISTTGNTVTVSIASNGTLTTSDAGCTGTGTIAPRASGKNVFDVSVTFGGSPCLAPNQTATGIGLVYPLASGQTQLIAAIKTAARDAGIAVAGIR